VTLGFGQIIIAIIRTSKVLFGATGFTGLRLMTNFAWVWGLAILCILTVRNLADSSIGRSMRAVRDDEVAAEAAGIDTTRIKVLAFVVSSMWAGVAGGLQAHLLMMAHPDNFAFFESIKVVVMVVLGGLGSITGSAFAAVILRILEEKLRSVSWAFGCGLVLCLMAAFLTLPRYRLAMKEGIKGWLLWLRWPVVALGFICWLYFAQRPWLESNVASLRYVIYALILIVLMLLRPQGLFGRAEFGMHLFRRSRNDKDQ
jgi:branched-chain amino acid transport system permease protein